MEKPSRRWILRIISLLTASSLAGCVAGSGRTLSCSSMSAVLTLQSRVTLVKVPFDQGAAARDVERTLEERGYTATATVDYGA